MGNPVIYVILKFVLLSAIWKCYHCQLGIGKLGDNIPVINLKTGGGPTLTAPAQEIRSENNVPKINLKTGVGHVSVALGQENQNNSRTSDEPINNKGGNELIPNIRSPSGGGSDYFSEGCAKPPQPENGFWTFYNYSFASSLSYSELPVGTVLVFKCNEGYLLSTNNEDTDFLVCEEGKWNTTSIPVCNQKCPSFYNTSIITVVCKNRYTGNILPCDKATTDTWLSYSCNEFYAPAIPYKTVLQCYEGYWDFKELPLCIPDCGRKTVKAVPLLVGGAIAKVGEYPWVVALYSNQQSDPDFENICGGSILTSNIVLTAAHCVTDLKTGKRYPNYYFQVCAGKFFKDLDDPRDANTTQKANVERIIIYEEYRGERQNYRYDIAILKLNSHFSWTDYVQPVCYRGVKQYVARDVMAWVAGWGYTTAVGEPSEFLKVVSLPIRDREVCSKEFDEDWADQFFTDEKLCAGYTNQSTSVCKGDSGGGLVIRHTDNKKFHIYGLVSLGHSYTENNQRHCSIQKTALFTKIYYYYKWIEENVAQIGCERCKNQDLGLSTEGCNFCYCTQTYCPVNSNRINAGASESSSSIGCTTPAQPENGAWKYKHNNITGFAGQQVVQDTAIYFKCNKGYILSPDLPYIVCEKDGWSTKSMPKCEQLCPILTNTSLGTMKCWNNNDLPIDCERATQFSYYILRCPQFYTPTRTTPTYCLHGVWANSTEPHCEPVCGEEPPERIISGTMTSPLKNPWAISVFKNDKDIKNNKKFIYHCGGTLLTMDIVLTAAQCFAINRAPENIEKFRLAAGAFYNIYLDPRDNGIAQYSEIEKVMIRPNYRGFSDAHREDLAVLKLKKPLKIDSSVMPICFKNPSNYPEKNIVGSMTGWGYIKSGLASEKRLEIDFPLIDRTSCLKAFKEEWAYTFITSDKICAGSVNKSLPLCTGDSGAGLILKDPQTRKYYIRGVASLWSNDNFYDECWNGTVRIFTDISVYYDWIKEQVSLLSGKPYPQQYILN